MKFIYLVVLSIICFVLQITAQSSNFIGTIKYIPIKSVSMPGDTLIVYFGKQKIRTSRLGTLAEQFGGVTDEIIDFAQAPNETVVYFGMGTEKNSEIIKSTKSGIDSVVTFSDSSKIILGYQCVKSIIYYAPSNHFGSHRMIDTVWSATSLPYLAPPTAVTSPWHPDFSTGGIPLLSTRAVYSTMTDGSKKVTINTIIACEVQPLTLTDDVFIIR